MVSPSDLWTEYDKKEFTAFVNVLIKLKIFKLKRYDGLSFAGVEICSTSGQIMAKWEKN